MLRFDETKLAKEEICGPKKVIKIWDIDINDDDDVSHLKINRDEN